MSCDIFENSDTFDNYMSGNLSEQERERFEEHFFVCSSCFQKLKIKQEMISVIQEEGDVLFAEFISKKKKTIKPNQFKQFLSTLFPKKKWIPAFAPVAIIFLILGSILISKNFLSHRDLSIISFDTQVPIPYSQERIVPRSMENRQNLTDFQVFNNRFLNSISYYNEFKYGQTIKMLSPLLGDAEKLEKNILEKEYISTIRDYYFYFGVSYLAAAQSKNILSVDSLKQQYLQQSQSLLEKSKKMDQKNHLDQRNRTTYFLGLSYFLAGFKQKADLEFQQIETNSDFHKKITELK